MPCTIADSDVWYLAPQLSASTVKIDPSDPPLTLSDSPENVTQTGPGVLCQHTQFTYPYMGLHNVMFYHVYGLHLTNVNALAITMEALGINSSLTVSAQYTYRLGSVGNDEPYGKDIAECMVQNSFEHSTLQTTVPSGQSATIVEIPGWSSANASNFITGYARLNITGVNPLLFQGYQVRVVYGNHGISYPTTPPINGDGQNARGSWPFSQTLVYPAVFLDVDRSMRGSSYYYDLNYDIGPQLFDRSHMLDQFEYVVDNKAAFGVKQQVRATVVNCDGNPITIQFGFDNRGAPPGAGAMYINRTGAVLGIARQPSSFATAIADTVTIQPSQSYVFEGTFIIAPSSESPVALVINVMA